MFFQTSLSRLRADELANHILITRAETMKTNNTSTTFNVSIKSSQLSTALPYPYPIVFVLLYTIAAVLSVVGNVAVVIVLIVRKRLTKGVRYSLVNLAAADFFMAVICLPSTCINQVYGQWLLPSAMCHIVMFVQDAMQVASVLTLTLIGIDRYFAILFPLKFRWLRSDRAIIIALVIIWILAIGNCMMVYFYSQHTTLYINGVEISQCNYAFPSKKVESGYVLSNFLITYPIPIVILVFCYTFIAWKLFHHTSPGNADSERDQRRRQNIIKAVRMLALIVVVFVLCWTPLQIIMMITYVKSSVLELGGTTQRILVVCFTWLGLSNCFANPFIYCFSNNEFWKDLKFIYDKFFNTFISKREKLKYQSSTATTTSQLSL